MKTQIKVQKILCLVTLIIAALSFVYACSFMTGDLSCLFKYLTTQCGDEVLILSFKDSDPIGADSVYQYASDINGVLVVLSIVLIVITVALFITASNKRRNYYITNYVAIIGVAIAFVVIAIIGMVLVSSVKADFDNKIDWEMYEYFGSQKFPSGAYRYGKCSRNNIMFNLGYAMYSLVIVNAVALVLNLIWKIMLMRGEKALLSEGFVKEAA